MKYSILVLGVFDLGSASATAIAPQQKAANWLTAFESHPDFSYTGTNEDGDQEEVETGKG
ncbi:MAG TPA: hypothetical protein DCS91_16090 [Microcoleaceae bacterium UBA11344]|jgi:hypothetical protein|nr:hypothetical protein [Microcoleaceae cyanobacterium UBA11344]